MAKRVFGRKLGRARKAREALVRSLIRALVMHGAIKTTSAKAKAISGDVDKIMTLVAKGDLAAKRLVLSKLGNDIKLTEMLFKRYASVAKGRKSGFTRIVRLQQRRGDQAEVVRLEFVEIPPVEEKKSTKKTTKKETEKRAEKKLTKRSSSKKEDKKK